MRAEEKNAVAQFLMEIEELILKQERGIEQIKNKQRDRQYIEDLLDVMKASKIGFVEEVSTSKEEKQQELLEILKKIISNDQEYHQIIQEIPNLYFLKKTGLITRKEVLAQKERAEAAINIIIEKCEEYLDTLKDTKDEQRKKDTYRFMESLFDLATKFDDNELVQEISDLNFFQEMVNLVSLPDNTKLDLISYVFEKSNELEKKQDNKTKKNTSYHDLTKFYEEESPLENTEELLDEILGEDTSNSMK